MYTKPPKRLWLAAVSAVTILATTAPLSHAQTSAADALSGRMQLEFCATYAPCAIAVGIMDGVNDAQNGLDKVKRYFSGLGRKPAMNAAEFRAFVESQSPAWRKDQVSRCLNYKGSIYQEFCEETYFTADEQRQAKEAREPKRVEYVYGTARQARADILDRDDKLYNGLWVNCKDERAGSTGCDEAMSIFALLKANTDRLNADPSFIKHFPAIRLRTEDLASKTHVYNGSRWVRRPEGALAQQQKFDACEALRRSTFNAIDEGRVPEGRTLADRLGAECGALNAEFRSMADVARQRITREAPPDPLAALPRRDSAVASNQVMSETLQRAQRGEALDDKTLPGRGGAAVAAGAGSTGAGGGNQGIVVLASIFKAVAQNSPHLSSNPVISGLLQGMRAQEEQQSANTEPFDAAETDNEALTPGVGSPSDGVGGGASDGSCAASEKQLEAELDRRNATIAPNDNVSRLALIRSITLRMRDAWRPCNPEKVKVYEQTAASTLNTCLGIASNASLCTGDQPRASQRTGPAQPSQSQAVRMAPPSSGTPQSSPCPPGLNLTTRGCKSGVAQ